MREQRPGSMMGGSRDSIHLALGYEAGSDPQKDTMAVGYYGLLAPARQLRSPEPHIASSSSQRRFIALSSTTPGMVRISAAT
jgi:hypothetical protein